MKKVLTAILLVLTCACVVLGMTACGGDKLNGSVYVYEKVEFTGDFSNNEKEAVTAMAEKSEFSFKDGKMTQTIEGGGSNSVSYKLKGDEIVVEAEGWDTGSMKIVNGKLVIEQTMDNKTATMTYKKK